jgi:hypothetical protein
MSTATRSRKRVKPERRIRLIKPIQDGMGAVQICIGGEPHNYLILPLTSDFGLAFRLVKQELVPQTEGYYELKDTARYNVNLDGQQSTCECLGFCKHGHCKHVSGLTVLRQRNLL